MRVSILLCLTLLLTACAKEVLVPVPEVVEVVNTEYIDVPEELTLPCPKTLIPADLTYGQALEMWAKDRSAIDTCNGRLVGIKSLSDTSEQGID